MRRDADRGIAGGGRRAGDGGGASRPRCASRAGRWRLADVRPWRRRFRRSTARAGHGQLGNGGALADGIGGEPADPFVFQRRSVAFRRADGPRHRAVDPDRRQRVGARRRPAAAGNSRRDGTTAHRVPAPSGLGAGEIGCPPGRPQRPGANQRDRAGADARSHGTPARRFRRESAGRDPREWRSPHHRRGRAGAVGPTDNDPRRHLLGGVSDRRGALGSWLARDLARGGRESIAHRSARHACRDGGADHDSAEERRRRAGRGSADRGRAARRRWTFPRRG